MPLLAAAVVAVAAELVLPRLAPEAAVVVAVAAALKARPRIKTVIPSRKS